MPGPTGDDRLLRRDYLLLIAFCIVLFGVSLISGRPLSIHEAVLPQSARTMLDDADWIVPKRGGAPWLESPPLPQWVTVCLAMPLGRCDKVWIARMGPTLMSTCVVLMVAWMASRWFGRTIGLLSGFIMATTCQFVRYAWLAEDEMFLCAIVTAALALFTKLEFSDSNTDQANTTSEQGFLREFLGSRSWLMLAFFFVLGMTNLAKGLLFGTTMVLIPIFGFLLWNADVRRIMRYSWLWGWLTFAVVALAWPLAAYWRFPDVLDLWVFDLGGRLTGDYTAINEPVWYYPLNLLWILAPWSLVVPFAFWATRHQALKQRYSPQRFVWCWALLVPAVFSIPHGKHHHYLLHSIAPWAILSSFGLVWIRQWILSWPRAARNPLTGLFTIAIPTLIALWLLRERIVGPDWITHTVMLACPIVGVGLAWVLLHKNARFAAGGLFSFLLVVYVFGHWYAGTYVDKHRKDAVFLQQVRQFRPAEAPLLVDLSVEGFRAFFCLFYLDRSALPLHNLSFVFDDRIRDKEVYLVTQYRRREQLQQIGTLEVVLQSEQTGGERSIEDRLTLFRMNYHTNVPRVSSANARISPMQSMYRQDGPYLGRRL